MLKLSSSVGKGGINKKRDVKLVQFLLNVNRVQGRLSVDGLYGPKTMRGIIGFQRKIMPNWKPDGRVDPKGRTYRELILHLTDGEQNKVERNITFNENNTVRVNKKVSLTDHVVNYSQSISQDKRIVCSYSFEVIRLALALSGLSKAVITSTIRLPVNQATIMYKNAKINYRQQKRLYGRYGDRVLDVFKANESKESSEVIKLMTQEIELLANEGKKVSRHCTTIEEYKKYNVIDIGVNSTRLANKGNFDKNKLTAVFKDLEKEGYISKFIDETKKSNNCWHIEVTPNAKNITRFK